MTTATKPKGIKPNAGEVVRSVAFEVERADENGDGLTLSGYAAVFNSPTRIDSWEGEFDEQIAPGAFRKTLRERTPVLQFDHGHHPLVGSLPLGRIESIREDERGLYVEARLSGNWLVEPVRDAIRDGAVTGMSFRFRVVKDTVAEQENGIPLRTLKEVALFELGPVVFPAYEGTSVDVRDRTTDRDADGAAEGTPAAPVAADNGEPPPALVDPTPTTREESRAMNEEQLREAVEYLRACLRDLDARAGDKPMTADERARFDEGKTALTQYEAELAEIVSRKDYLRSLAAAPAYHDAGGHDPLGETRANVPPRGSDNPWDLDAVQRNLMLFGQTAGTTELRSRALSAVERVPGISDRAREHVTSILDSLDLDDAEMMPYTKRAAAHIIAVSSPQYMTAWSRCLRAAIRGQQHEDMKVLQRAMSLTDAAGGFAVPLPVDPTLVPNYDVTVHPFRQIATTRTIVTDALRTVNSTGVAFSWDGEAAEVSDDATTFANIDIPVHKAQGFIPFSIEIGGDYPGFTEDVRMLLSDGKDDLEADAFATGTGTNQPTGIVTALVGGSSIVTSATTDTFAAADVYNLEAALPAKWRARGQFVAHKSIYQRIRQFDTAGGAQFWENLGNGQPLRLLGYPNHEAEGMDGVINALAENYVLLFGDWRNYYIVDRVGFSMELVPHLFHTANNRPSGQRGFYAWWRVGADSVNDRAFRLLNVT